MAVDATVLGGTTARVNASKLMRLFGAAGRSDSRSSCWPTRTAAGCPT